MFRTAAAGRRIRWMLLGPSALAVVVLVVWSGSVDAATTFTVNRVGDAADRRLSDAACDTSRERGRQCTLRAAIQEANDTPGADTINFGIVSTAAVKTISPTRPLPVISTAVTINGYSQPGSRANTLATGNNAVLKVVLNGTNAGQFTDGLIIRGANTTVKGLVINRFRGSGVRILGVNAVGNKVLGNFIGTDASGTADLGNLEQGVWVSAGRDNTIGGTAASSRNVISGNGHSGVAMGALDLPEGWAYSSGNEVLGNYIGTDKSGTADLGNGSSGVVLGKTTDNTIGGTAYGARNVISGNGGDGVAMGGSHETWPSGNDVLGNYIGTNASGTRGLANTGSGVRLRGWALGNTIGGTASGAGNRIAFNGQDGVSAGGENIGGNDVLSNSIYSNGGLGIDLNDDGVTNNEPDDADFLQNFPEISSAAKDSTTGTTTITGTLNSRPEQTCTIQCFVTEMGGDPSGHGEGQRLLDTTTTTTNADGDSPTFSCAGTGLVVGDKVSATATNTATNAANDDTSEFSQNATVTAGP